jgi:hypothetical protein
VIPAIDFSRADGPNIKVSAFARFTGLSESYIRAEIEDGRIKAATYGRGKRRRFLLLYASVRQYAIDCGFVQFSG